MIPHDTIYDRLLLLPLFQGMSSADLMQLAGKTKFGFHRYKTGQVVATEGEACERLCFLMDGTLEVCTTSDDHGYSLFEDIKGPAILQPEHIFGLTQRFTRTFTAQSQCSMMTLQKPEVARLTGEYEVFRINLLNIISTQSQRLQRRLWHQQPTSLEQRIVRFIESHSLRPAGQKTFFIKMLRLAEELNASRLDVSQALHRLENRHLVSLGRGKFTVFALEQLLANTK